MYFFVTDLIGSHQQHERETACKNVKNNQEHCEIFQSCQQKTSLYNITNKCYSRIVKGVLGQIWWEPGNCEWWLWGGGGVTIDRCG